MSLCCELSGAAVVEPVVSPTGHLFEKRLIESHLEKNATCPISGKPLSKKDLIPIASTTIKRPSAILTGDVTSLLKSIQDHIDALQLENYRLLQERDQLRQQMTQLLYLRDGSTRVVAQKLEEIKLLQNRIAALESGAGQLKAATQQSQEQIASLIAKWETLSANLLQARKKREIRTRPAEEFADMKLSREISVDHQVTCFDLIASGPHGDDESSPGLVACGTKRGVVDITNYHENQVIASLNGHEGPVTCIRSLMYPTVADLPPASLAALGASSESCAPFKSCLNILTGGADKTLRHWVAEDLTKMDEIDWMIDAKTVRGPAKVADLDRLPSKLNFSCQHVYRFDGAVRAIALHPSGTHAGVVTGDETWSLIDLVSNSVVCEVKCQGEQLRDIAIQPDGLVVVGASATNRIPVWDLRTRELKAAPAAPETVTGTLTSVSFSESGYHIVTPTTCGKLLLWDLRKSEVTQTFELPSGALMSRFDHSGKHILTATKEGTVVHSMVEKKKYGEIAVLNRSHDHIMAQFDKLTDAFILILDDNSLTMYS